MIDESDRSLSLDDVMCPICLDILIKPVTLACNHEMCKECYFEHFEKSNFSCPMCKKRLSTWARRAATQGTLVNEQKWDKIKKQYPDLVKSRVDGNSNTIFTNRSPVDFRIAKPGELQEEYLALRQDWLVEQSEERRKQEEASLLLINQIHEEEKADLERKRKQQQENDKKLALQLSEELHMNVSPSRVNKVILRPRKLLASIDLNPTGASPSRKRKASSTKPSVGAPKRRRRAVSTAE